MGPKSVEALQAFFDHPEPPLAPDEWIEKQLMALTTKPTRKVSAGEAAYNLEISIAVLRQYPQVDLGYAIGRLMRESVFRPGYAEIATLAEYPARVRAAKKHQAWKLIHKHKTEYVPEIPEDQLCKPEDVAAILAEFKTGETSE